MRRRPSSTRSNCARKFACPGKLVPSASHTVIAFEPSSHAQVDAVVVVLDRRVAHGGIGVAEAAELVRDGAVARRRGVVLEGVGVHRVERDAALVRVLAQRVRIGGVVPGHVERRSSDWRRSVR